MAKMREVKVYKVGQESVHTHPTNSHINADGVKITICKPQKNAKTLTARCKG